MPAIIDDLDDVEALIAVDRDGLLRSAAMAGAQVRAIAEAQSEGVLDRLGEVRPRAVVIVIGGSALASRAAALVVAALAARIDVPLVVSPALPGWTGPLDVVVIAGQDAGDPHLSDAVTRAQRRHAEVAVLAPIEGPLRDAVDAGARTGGALIDLSPRLTVDPRFTYPGIVAGLLAVLTGLTAVRLSPTPPPLAELADQLDAEAAADHPEQHSFHNQAKLLAQRVSGRPCVWAGDTPAATAAAAQAAAGFLAIAGEAGGAADEATAVDGLRRHRAAGPAVSIFHDPEIDGPAPAAGPRLLLLTTAARAWYAQQRIAGLADAELVTEAVVDPEAAPQPAAPEELATDSPTDLAAYLLLTARAGLAAAYLALMGQPS